MIELLSPVGNFDCLVAAVQNGANAIYLGATSFNARANNSNFDTKELEKAIEYAKIRNVATHLTLNTLITNNEFHDAINIAKTAYQYGIDGIIVQDLGLGNELIKLFPNLPIHASTQTTTYNLDGINILKNLGYKKAVLARELSLDEISYICQNTDMDMEVFVHGALCICYSGQCLMSSIIGGRSGNRGKCAQPCRLPYQLIKNESKTIEKGHLLSSKDICTLDYLPQLINAGVKSFKIEGRMKSPEYVAATTKIYRKYINIAISQNSKNYSVSEEDKTILKQVFNRGGFSSGYLNKKSGKSMMFFEKPNNIGLFLGEVLSFNPNKGYIKLKLEHPISIGDSVSIHDYVYNVSEVMFKNHNTISTEIGQIIEIGRIKGNINVGNPIYKTSDKTIDNQLKDSFSGKEFIKRKINADILIKKNELIKIRIYGIENIDFEIIGQIIPDIALNTPISKDRILSQINKTGNTPFEFEQINIKLDNDVIIPISSLNDLRRTALETLEKTIIYNSKRIIDIDINSKLIRTDKSIHLLKIMYQYC